MRGKNIRKIRALGKQIKPIIPLAMGAALLAEREGGRGGKKLARAAELLASAVDIPFLWEGAEQMLFQVLLVGVVEVCRAVWGKKKWAAQIEEAMGLEDVSFEDYGVDDDDE